MSSSKGPITIALHGGAYNVPDNLVDIARVGAKKAIVVGWNILLSGGSAVDAVEAVVATLEDLPQFNAGHGSSLTSEKTVEMDAFIMDGQSLKVGAVAGVDCVDNPIKLARVVMEKTEHCLFGGKGARKIAEQEGFHIVDPKLLPSEESLRRFNEYETFLNTLTMGYSMKNRDYDTVGAVALDQFGNLASATSTGGLTGKLIGRIGDSPLAGSGGYADNNYGAVSTTGHGEAIMRMCLAHRIVLEIRTGLSPTDSAKNALSDMASRIHSAAGLIAVSSKGEVAAEFTTEKMVWAWIQNGTLHHGVLPNEHITEDLFNI